VERVVNVVDWMVFFGVEKWDRVFNFILVGGSGLLERTNAEAKCGGLSTALLTMRL
jgi:hypothetical protein